MDCKTVHVLYFYPFLKIILCVCFMTPKIFFISLRLQSQAVHVQYNQVSKGLQIKAL